MHDKPLACNTNIYVALVGRSAALLLPYRLWATFANGTSGRGSKSALQQSCGVL